MSVDKVNAKESSSSSRYCGYRGKSLYNGEEVEGVETLDGCIMGRRSFRTVLCAGHDLLSIYTMRTTRLDGGLVAGLANFHATSGTKDTLDVAIDGDCKEC